MTVTIPEKYMDLFEKRTFADLATIMPDGSPQVTPIWIDFDGTHVLDSSYIPIIGGGNGETGARGMMRVNECSICSTH